MRSDYIRASADGVVPFLEEALAAVSADRRVRLRMDAGIYAKSVERRLGF